MENLNLYEPNMALKNYESLEKKMNIFKANQYFLLNFDLVGDNKNYNMRKKIYSPEQKYVPFSFE